MTRLADVFNTSRQTALIAYVTVGYPSVEATLKLVPLLARSGCDIVELGIPFSDPMADGATIQKTSHEALLNGVTPDVCIDVARQLSSEVDIPLVFMSYYNPMLKKGLDAFCGACAEAGVSGLIVPDLPPDEGGELEMVSSAHGVDLIYLLAPTATEERIRLVAERSRGFIYMVSLAGVTGARASIHDGLEDFVDRVRAVAKQPLCVGFGISSPEQAVRVAKVADGVIVGSRILKLVEQDDSFEEVALFVRTLRSALDSADA
ncbi:MAG: tryptophan synthase subunit alpha [Dehalococcoidia bacterium]|nr:tryptophan synthase subunit alpha [Dehalococcoidia bacterium]